MLRVTGVSKYLFIMLSGCQLALLAADPPPPPRSLWKSAKRIYQFVKANPELLLLAKDTQQYLPRDADGNPIITKGMALKVAAAAAVDVISSAVKERVQDLATNVQTNLAQLTQRLIDAPKAPPNPRPPAAAPSTTDRSAANLTMPTAPTEHHLSQRNPPVSALALVEAAAQAELTVTATLPAPVSAEQRCQLDLIVADPTRSAPTNQPLLSNAFWRLGHTTAISPALMAGHLTAEPSIMPDLYTARFTRKLLQLQRQCTQKARRYFAPTVATKQQRPPPHYQHAPIAAPPLYANLTTDEALWLHFWRQQIQREQAQIPQLNAYFAQAKVQQRLFSLAEVRPLQLPAPRPVTTANPPHPRSALPLGLNPRPQLTRSQPAPPPPPIYHIRGLGAVVCRQQPSSATKNRS